MANEQAIDWKNLDVRQVQRYVAAIEMIEREKHNPASGTPAVPLHDSGGIFSYPYSDEFVLSAIQQPQSFIDTLPLRPSVIRNEVSEILTAQMGAVGDVPDDFCGDPQTPGALYTCRVVSPIGKMYLGSEKVSVADVAMRDTYGARPRQVINGAAYSSPLIPDALRRPFVAGSETSVQLMKLATNVKRSIATIECTGDASLTGGNRRAGWVAEWNGLDLLIADITDISGEDCPAASSLVETWDADIAASVNGLTLPQLLHQVYYSRAMLADDLGYTSPNLTWVMSKRLFYQLVQQFACTYATARCELGDASNPITRAYADIERLRNEMYNGAYLLIDGIRTPVLFTSGAEVDDSTTTLDSPIYLIPRRPDHTFIEYYPFNDAEVTAFLSQFGGSTVNARVSNNGLYILANRADGMCFQLLAAAQMRLMIKARFLAARIDGVQYTSYVGYRDWDPAGSSFYSGGTSFFNSGV